MDLRNFFNQIQSTKLPEPPPPLLSLSNTSFPLPLSSSSSIKFSRRNFRSLRLPYSLSQIRASRCRYPAVGLLNQCSAAMGQVLEKFQGKEWRQRQTRKIINNVFDRVKNDMGRANLTFEDLYIAVLLVYNEINKRLPGPHFDPPMKEQVRAMMQDYDLNLDGELDREEFAKFIQQLTADTVITVSQGLIITLAIAPVVALMTKKTTEGIPGVGKVVQRLPSSVYASLVTLAVVTFQSEHRND